MRSATLLVCMLFAACRFAAADDERLPLWRIEGEANRIYLLGSVHLLRESDYPIPDAIYDAYADADTLVMELDIDDLDPAAVRALVNELGMIQGGGSLEEILGPEAFAKAAAYAEAASIPLQALADTEPWFAAITVEQMTLQRIGFDPAHGIEAHLAGRAADDRKEIVGLETLREQLELLDGLPAGAQRALLLQTLEDSLDIGDIMNDMIRAWRRGDTAFLEHAILEDMRGYPDLYSALVVRRNRAWAVAIEEMLSDADDYLVVVGALHLIGSDGVPALLNERGKTVVQLSTPHD